MLFYRDFVFFFFFFFFLYSSSSYFFLHRLSIGGTRNVSGNGKQKDTRALILTRRKRDEKSRDAARDNVCGNAALITNEQADRKNENKSDVDRTRERERKKEREREGEMADKVAKGRETNLPEVGDGRRDQRT